MKTFQLRICLLLTLLLMVLLGIGQNTYQTIGLIGTSTPNAWNASTPMKQASATDPHKWTLTLRLTQGEVKFRANDSWDVNWGGTGFPSGTGTRNGPNIQVPATRYYTVSFDDNSGAYTFQALDPTVYEAIGLIGDATPAGWNASTAMNKDPNDPHSWTLDISLSQGEVKFRANNSWDVNWGGHSFPSGTGIQNGSNIAVAAGQYTVTFNDVTREYFFKNLNPPVYTTVGIIGTATAKGWDASTPMQLVRQGDPNDWTLTAFLKAGELKFRANDSWEVNWGGTDFPSGMGTRNGPNIKITDESWYTIKFNDYTGAYSFAKLTPATYASVGIIGTATLKGWEASTPLNKEADGHTWNLKAIKLSSGEAKFRANDAWTVNWGSTAFPTGVGTQDGPNIPVAGGIYNILFNDITGEYGFELTGTNTDAIVVLSPAKPTADESLTITYDASKGVSGLQGAGKVYLHSGVVLSGPDGTTWSNVVGNWGQDDGIGAMTPVAGAPNKWQITLPGIRNYYNIENGVPVFRLGMVFRNADGTHTGKSESNGDIFVNLDPGAFVRLTAPTAGEVFATTGQQVVLSAEAASAAGTITLEVNEGSGYQTVKQVSNSQTISYNYTVGSASSLQIRVTAQIEDKTVTAERSLSIRIRKQNAVVALPAGMHNGINYHPGDPSKATLVLLAPRKEFAYVVGDFNNWQLSDAYQMNQTPDGEYFWLELSNLEPGKEYVYQYWVEGTIKVGDPYADKIADPFNDGKIPASVYPDPVGYNRTGNGIATVLQTGQQAYQWKNPTVKGGRPAKENLVVYELLLRDFLSSHSYKDLTDTLVYLKRLGVNAIELMPIMEFEGNESWGYNPSYLFAPDKYYGTKNDLKAFIDKAHEQGFVVLLDMVLNHQFGQSPMVRMYWDEANGRPSAASPWFNAEPTHPYNVGYDFNHESAYTKRYIDDVNRYWIEEYKFDGYRFDLTKGFTQTNNPNDVGAWSRYDQSRINILKRMTEKIWETDADAYVIFEHLADNDEEKVLADYGIMLWGNMNYSYINALNGHTDTDLNWALYNTRGWNGKNLVSYMESHDEERLLVRAKNEGLSSGGYNIKEVNTALERVKLASAFYFPLPGPKMLWQFGELGYDIPIDYNGRTGNKPSPWSGGDGLGYDKDKERVRLYKATAAIIKLVNDHNHVFEGGSFSWTPSGQFRKINVSHSEMNVTIVGNFGLSAGRMQPGFQHAGIWYDYFSGNAFKITSISGSVALAPGEFRIYVDKPVDFPEPGLVTSSIRCVTAASSAGTIACYGGKTTVTVTGNGGTAPYTGTGTFTVGAGKHNYTVTDANGCMATTTVTITEPAQLVATASNNNPQLYFGYSGDQAATIKATPSGGVAPYKVEIAMNRPLKCNSVNDAGDEIWTAAGGVTVNNTCPAYPGVATLSPVSTITEVSAGGSFVLNVTLMEDAVFTITVTDAAGCSATSTTQIKAEDVRCISGNSGEARVTLCHKTGNAKKPCITVCVGQLDVQEHLSHGDYIGNCAPDCVAPAASTSSIKASANEGVTTVRELQVSVLNNPARRNEPFLLHLSSNDQAEGISLRIMNGAGKFMEWRQKLRTGQTVEIGAAYAPGMYFVEVLQGRQRKVAKLIKQ